ncbi:MAG: heme ABC exporter ATP-binding protein CcmA [Cereibacter sphaeroides]|uniref:Heme ABC exporter ATP-binding protein CcmA n=1 Tax=Cereibacter sphaeroides TaxID=1063 RepID=A0A2W5S9W4_CERSP|nr:MAG: heme ABC exporter ATP-binding protein CcmA [Cereibacter sphaeroides]
MELRVTDLACARGGVILFDGLSFVLPPGGALMLRGPNGAGKTTLLRTLAGLQPVVSGQVSLPPEAMAYAGHADGLKAALTVQENLGFWAAIHGGGDVGAALRAMSLQSLADRPARDLSAGQKRRLGLSRLLVTGRKVWLLDEPTVSLDAESVTRFAGVLSAHLAQGGSALVATHADIGLAAAVLDLGGYRARRSAEAGFDEAFA